MNIVASINQLSLARVTMEDEDSAQTLWRLDAHKLRDRVLRWESFFYNLGKQRCLDSTLWSLPSVRTIMSCQSHHYPVTNEGSKEQFWRYPGTNISIVPGRLPLTLILLTDVLARSIEKLRPDATTPSHTPRTHRPHVGEGGAHRARVEVGHAVAFFILSFQAYLEHVRLMDD